jgi:hypothetical protein
MAVEVHGRGHHHDAALPHLGREHPGPTADIQPNALPLGTERSTLSMCVGGRRKGVRTAAVGGLVDARGRQRRRVQAGWG